MPANERNEKVADRLKQYDKQGVRRRDNTVVVQPGSELIIITNREPGVFGQYFWHPFNKGHRNKK